VQKITPHLWFDKEAKEAAEFYISLLPNSKITSTATLHNTPSGDCDLVSFELSGQPFMAITKFSRLLSLLPSVILSTDRDRPQRMEIFNQQNRS
jgi:predicted 3-demethylubiquinone-9 3-methyltransferase (glyoxalase superfamily)